MPKILKNTADLDRDVTNPLEMRQTRNTWNRKNRSLDPLKPNQPQRLGASEEKHVTNKEPQCSELAKRVTRMSLRDIRTKDKKYFTNSFEENNKEAETEVIALTPSGSNIQSCSPLVMILDDTRPEVDSTNAGCQSQDIADNNDSPQQRSIITIDLTSPPIQMLTDEVTLTPAPNQYAPETFEFEPISQENETDPYAPVFIKPSVTLTRCKNVTSPRDTSREELFRDTHFLFDLDWKDYNDSTPLHWAAFRGYLNIVKTLVDEGARLNVQDNCGWTPLHMAVMQGHTDCVEVLLKAHANPFIEDREFLTPMDMAKQLENTDIVNTMYSYMDNYEIIHIYTKDIVD